MKTRMILMLSVAWLVACGGRPAGTAARNGDAADAAAPQSTAVEPVEYTYRVKATYDHPRDAYTQGLLYADGKLWEGTGQYGHSVVQKIDLTAGRYETVVRLPRSEFGEGIALLDGKLYQLTWLSNTCHVYDVKHKMKKIKDFRYPGEGWGLTTDGQKLYMSDGTAKLYTVDPATFRRESRVTVTYQGEPVDYLNELEWIEGKIWANVYTTQQIVIIDPATGIVEGVVDLTGILPAKEVRPTTDVLNGIAYDAEGKRIFVTGKNWSKLFEIEIIRK